MATMDLNAVLRDLGAGFAQHAAEYDSGDHFVRENFAALKERRVMSAGVPGDLGGGDASHREVADFLRQLAHCCSSTALALSMHMHQVMIPAWRWRNEGGVGEPLLRRVAAEQLVLVSSGGSDWIDSSGSMEKVDGGYRMTARKIFSSGSPVGDLLMTSAVYAEPDGAQTVLHFALPLNAEGVTVGDNWRTLGMRATGSNDVMIEGAFVPDAAIGGRRPKGKWGIFHLVTMVALPLIYAVYVGVAERARDIALEQARKRSGAADVRMNVGEMENQLRLAQMSLDGMLSIAETSQPGPETSNEIMIRRALAGRAAIATVDRAMDVAGGAAFFRDMELERLFRDIQAARYHPLQDKRQLEFTGRYTLGLEID